MIKGMNDSLDLSRRYIFTLTILCLSLIGCKVPEKTILPEVQLNTSTEYLLSYVSEIGKEVRYIPLGSTNEMPVGNIRLIRVSHENIFVLSGDMIFCFDIGGCYRFRLEKKGRGPGEYLRIGSFDVDSSGELLILHTFGRLLFYRITEDGFVFDKELVVRAGSGYHLTGLNFVPGTHNVLISYSTEGVEEYRNVLIDDNGDTLLLRANHYRYRPSAAMGFVSPEEVLQFSDGCQLYFKELFNDTVYVVGSQNTLDPVFVLSSGKDGLTPDIIANLSRESAPLLKDKLSVYDMFRCNRLYFIRVAYKGQSYYEVVDIERKIRSRFYSGLILNDDISGGIGIEPKYSYGGRIYSWVEVVTLKEYLNTEHFHETNIRNDRAKQGFISIVNNLSEDDNPVLVVMALK